MSIRKSKEWSSWNILKQTRRRLELESSISSELGKDLRRITWRNVTELEPGVENSSLEKPPVSQLEQARNNTGRNGVEEGFWWEGVLLIGNKAGDPEQGAEKGSSWSWFSRAFSSQTVRRPWTCEPFFPRSNHTCWGLAFRSKQWDVVEASSNTSTFQLNSSCALLIRICDDLFYIDFVQIYSLFDAEKVYQYSGMILGWTPPKIAISTLVECVGSLSTKKSRTHACVWRFV
jgi:hypothetical protein